MPIKEIKVTEINMAVNQFIRDIEPIKMEIYLMRHGTILGINFVCINNRMLYN
jgi:hypothetical protein